MQRDLLARIAELEAQNALLRDALEAQEPRRCLTAFEDHPACGERTCGPCMRAAALAATPAAALREIKAQAMEDEARRNCHHCRQGWGVTLTPEEGYRHFPDEKRLWNQPCTGTHFHSRAAALRSQEAPNAS